MKTDRDGLFFDFDKEKLKQKIKKFYSPAGIIPPFKEDYRVENSSSYNLLERRKNTAFNIKNIHKCLYRPFDERWLYYNVGLTSRPAEKVMKHILDKNNLFLLSCRQQAQTGFFHIFCSNVISECCSVSLKTREITSCFPLYLYKGEEKKKNIGTGLATALMLFEPEEDYNVKQSNFKPEFISEFSNQLNRTGRSGLSFTIDKKS